MPHRFGQAGAFGSSRGSGNLGEPPDDPYDIIRFVRFQEHWHPIALKEVNRGRKDSCWSRGVIPTAPWVVGGRERGSQTNQEYCLRDLAPDDLDGCNTARAFLLYG
uniref:Uncharacterized protein n=1 Tax=Chromera velia CCMP2878 TaxID=1169474 RepID=A0A0G4I2S8_9ALVE|eukprot:Cvel_10474.t1-p1 / transcript=Cvel_10474.t1 / gene=Cvel_10474 / organism=Chromera_velia_CCMP2878 / gene_product=hypothetical protein / transcript_product=hypothetical protein / location=Cvel_scaffold632:29066-29380(+) / protein_length=105 / sequence_SO=supercontig / SO=protein_coding / is_pseudo=false